MLTFKSFDDLSQLPAKEPARPVIQNLLKSLITDANNSMHPYSPDHDGYVALVYREDLDEELDLFDPPRKLEDVFWEGTHIDRDFFIAVFVPNNQFSLVCVIENSDWLPKDLRRALCACLVPETT